MRTITLTVLILIASVAQVAAQPMPTLPPSTYPEAGTFCGLFTLCPKEALPKDGA